MHALGKELLSDAVRTGEERVAALLASGAARDEAEAISCNIVYFIM